MPKLFFHAVLALVFCFPAIHARIYEVMSYNVQNLLNVPDSERKENPFWTPEKLDLKLGQIADAILKERKSLPDFLGVNEIQGPHVAEHLAERLGYREFKMAKDLGPNGINSALFYNPSAQLVFKSIQEHELKGPHFATSPTRNILEVHFKVGKKANRDFTIFVSHWPSLAGPTEKRLVAARLLRKRIDQIAAKEPEHLLMAIGDFNTSPREHPNPLQVLLSEGKDAAPGMIDVHQAFMDSKKVSPEAKKRLPKGTHFYPKDMTWFRLDCILISRNLLKGKGAKTDVASYEIYAPNFLTDVYEYTDPKSGLFGTRITNIPKRYRHRAVTPEMAGFSDHFPVVVKIDVD